MAKKLDKKYAIAKISKKCSTVKLDTESVSVHRNHSMDPMILIIWRMSLMNEYSRIKLTFAQLNLQK